MATPQAATTFDDDLDVVKSMGVEDRLTPPPGAKRIHLSDVNWDAFHRVFELFEIEPPTSLAIAVARPWSTPQRRKRPGLPVSAMEKVRHVGRRLAGFRLQGSAPFLTRMTAVKQMVPHAFLMDTASAAIWGLSMRPLGEPADEDKRVPDRQRWQWTHPGST